MTRRGWRHRGRIPALRADDLRSCLGRIVRTELVKHGVQVFNGFAVERIESKGARLSVRSLQRCPCRGHVLVAVGSRPETALARSAGIETGVKDAICVNRRMETSVPDITQRAIARDLSPAAWEEHLSSPGHHRPIAGAHRRENAVEEIGEYAGTLGTQSVRFSISWRHDA